MCVNHTHSRTHAGQAQSRQHSGNTSEGFRSSGLEHELLPCWDREFWDQVVDRPEDTNVPRKAVNQRYTNHGVFAARRPQCHPRRRPVPRRALPSPQELLHPHHTHVPQQASKTTPHPGLRATEPQHTHRGKRPLMNTMEVVPSSVSLHFLRGSESHSGKYKSRNLKKKTFRNFSNANIIVLYPKSIP